RLLRPQLQPLARPPDPLCALPVAAAPTRLRLAARDRGPATGGGHMSAIAGQMVAERRPRLKRALDVGVSSLLLVLVSPLLLAVAIGVRLDSSDPVLFRQTRVGLNVGEFTMLKLWSMYADAEQRLAGPAVLNSGGSHLIRIPSDPRVT